MIRSLAQTLNPAKRDAILRAYRLGVKPWRIAKDRRIRTNDVLEVLVDSGEISLGYSQLLAKQAGAR